MVAAHRRWAAELLHLWFHRLRPAQWFGRSDAATVLRLGRFPHRNAVLARRSAP